MTILSRRVKTIGLLTAEFLLILFLLKYLISNSRYSDYKKDDLNEIIDTLHSSINFNNKAKGSKAFVPASYFEPAKSTKSLLKSEEIAKLKQMEYDRKEMERVKENDKIYYENLRKEQENQKTKEEEEKLAFEKMENERLKKRRHDKLMKNKAFLEVNKKEVELKLDTSNYEGLDLTEIDIPSGVLPFQDFMEKYIDVLEANKQSFPHPERVQLNDGKPIIWRIHFLDSPTTFPESELTNLLDFSNEFIDDLFDKHFNIVKAIPDKLPMDFYKGKGYVIVGGGKYSWFSLLSIRNLREIGSVLPVEVFIPNDDEWENDFCNVILPTLNARCVMMSQAFGPAIYDRVRSSLSGYQYKSFALLSSSFKDTFLLDSDTVPLVNPDPVFESSLFRNFKMVTWPDFWRRTVSPHYYEVAGVEIGKTKSREMNDLYTPLQYMTDTEEDLDPYTQISFHDRHGTLPDWSSESGQLLLDKAEHFNTLLLSLYYNFDGPYGYHPLLSQGGAGEGDKETFCAAAAYYNKPFYQLYKAPDKVFGYYNRAQDGLYEHTTIAQYDPLVDFDILVKNVYRVLKDISNHPDNYDYSYLNTYRFPWNSENCQPMFYHVHDPKYDPFRVINEKYNVDMKDENIRNLGEDLKSTKYDIELRIWELMEEYLCDSNESPRVKLKFLDHENKQRDLDEYCKTSFKKQIDFLKKTGLEILARPEEEKPQNIVTDITSAINNAVLTMEEYTEAEQYIFQKAGIQPPYHFKYENELKLAEAELRQRKTSEARQEEAVEHSQPATPPVESIRE